MQHPPKKISRRRVSMRWALALLLAAVIAAAALAWYVLGLPEPVAVTVLPSTQRTLESVDAAALVSVRVQAQGNEPYELYLQNGSLCLKRGDGWSPITQAYSQRILQACTQVVAQQVVTEDAQEVQLADMGLAPAQASVTVRYADGSEATLDIGLTAPHVPDVYARWKNTVFLCDASTVDVFFMSLDELLPVEQVFIAPSLVTAVRIQNKNGENCFAFEGGASGRVIAPVSYPLSDEGLRALLTSLSGFRLGTPLPEEVEGGFENPVCVLDVSQQAGRVNTTDENGVLVVVEREAQELRIVLGRAENEYFYTCLYNGNAYRVSRLLVEALAGANWRALVTRTPAWPGDEAIARLTLQTQAETLTVEVARTERVLANNQLEYDIDGAVMMDTAVTVNGESASEEQWQALTDRLYLLSAAGDVPPGYQPQGEPRWTLSWETENGGKRTVEGYRMDAFADAVALDGVCVHYVHADAIDALITGWR